MEIRFDQKNRGRKKNDTRMYAPSQGRKRVTFAPADEKELKKGAAARREEEPSGRAGGQENEIKGTTRLGLIVSTFIFAGMLLFMLSGYERITRSYQEINAINSQIEETKLSINALEVAIECAVTIDQAQEWAKAHQMQYPLQSQYVASGSAIPVSGAPTEPIGTTGPETGGAEGSSAEGAPNPQDAAAGQQPGA